ncbi:MAG: hypothetical protein AAF657_30800, partial [Acidobacteriota bacterium]
DEIVLIDPGSRGLATYGRDGRRRSEVQLDAAAQLDYSEPMRFERTDDGYVLIDRTQILSLGKNLDVHRREQPFVDLQAQGFSEGSFNDALLHRGRLYGYADFIETTEPPAASTGDEAEPSSIWRRGFVRLDPSSHDLDLLHELPIDSADGEYTSYYLYDRRPYVAELEGKVYILRFTEPWSIHKVTRKGLRPVVSGNSTSDASAHALQAWNGRLYVLTSRVVPTEDTGEQLKGPDLSRVNSTARVELLRALPAIVKGERQWLLHEIDPGNGERRRMQLPTAAERIRLVPGQGYWTAIEETSIPNLGETKDQTTFLFLPADELRAGSFSCGA